MKGRLPIQNQIAELDAPKSISESSPPPWRQPVLPISSHPPTFCRAFGKSVGSRKGGFILTTWRMRLPTGFAMESLSPEPGMNHKKGEPHGSLRVLTKSTLAGC